MLNYTNIDDLCSQLHIQQLQEFKLTHFKQNGNNIKKVRVRMEFLSVIYHTLTK